MYKVIAENVMIIVDNQWVATKAVLTDTSGGYQVHYTDQYGMILKKEAYSKSPYYKDKDKK